MQSFHNRVVVDPTKENRQAFLLFGIAVAGKSADQTVEKLSRFLWNGLPALIQTYSPFEKLRWMDEGACLDERLRGFKLGRYAVLGRAFRYLGREQPVLDDICIADLEAIPGVGYKTSRYFLLYTTDRTDIAALDTHILRWLREVLELKNVPRQTPSGRRYRELEKAFVRAARVRGLTPQELDNHIWQHYARGEVPLPN